MFLRSMAPTWSSKRLSAGAWGDSLRLAHSSTCLWVKEEEEGEVKEVKMLQCHQVQLLRSGNYKK